MLEALKRRTGFTAEHASRLCELGKVMSPMASELALAFYDYLGRDPEMRDIIWAEPGRVERLYRSFARWYQDIFSGQYDYAYAESRVRIGLVHARIGIRPSFMVPAMGVVQELSLEHMRMALRGSEIFASVVAFEKIVAIEVALIDESYIQALRVGLSELEVNPREALIQGAETLLRGGNS